ncbi:hypothetical protein LHK_02444 [Laribacter hongkongensis HLHK9]|uniref:Uncharacterized protein n=1 Tax=Laribacter hongkongensis (strain HLHK9) TaxID=557598 RepID=C1DB87_LARHH|nr:hypothetical protein LHK_02444 [Laribacter hongkongensis HLHK9]
MLISMKFTCHIDGCKKTTVVLYFLYKNTLYCCFTTQICLKNQFKKNEKPNKNSN